MAAEATQTFRLTEKQTILRDAAASPATHVLAYGGARSGKTFGFLYCVAVRALSAPHSRHLVARLHNIDVRQAVMMDTWPKMMRLAFPGVTYAENKQDQFVTLPNGSEVWFGGLDDKERVDKILGKEFATIYLNEASQIAYESVLTVLTRLAQNCTKTNGKPLSLKAYYDLNPVGRGHWTHKQFVEKLRPENGVALDNPADYACVRLNPTDNPHLPAATLAIYAGLPSRQRQRFFDGEYLSEVPGALWSLDAIDNLRRPRPSMSTMTRIVVAVDPSGSDGTRGDCQGIIVAGLGVDGDAYILSDRSCRLSPEGWARQTVNAYHEFGADTVVAETNFGAALVQHTIKTHDHNVAFKEVHASRGKHVRAEPVSALYEQGRVHHVKTTTESADSVNEFAELEEQLGMFTTAGYQGGGSPDRADALVWAITELMLPDWSDGAAFAEYARTTLASEATTPPLPGAVRMRFPAGTTGADMSDGTKYEPGADGAFAAKPEHVAQLKAIGCQEAT